MSRTSREIHLASRPDGLPIPENFRIVETTVPDAGAGEVLIRNVYMSVDPAMRPPLSNGQAKLDAVLGGGAIGRVEQSNHPDWSVGDYVMSRNGFREYFVSDASGLRLIELGDEPLTAHMHALGVTGFTAWGGLTITGELKDGENVFVSAAAGAVGSVAVQIAKNRGCRVAASAGSDEKVAFLREELGADHAFNYKKTSIAKELHIGLPDGIDVYFENVGGAHLDAAMGQMRPLGRVPVCGMISAYNTAGARSEGVTTLSNMIYNRVTMRGFVVYEFEARREEFLADMRAWIADGKMTWRETIEEGIEHAPQALIGLLRGENLGKMLVRLSDA